MEETRHFSPPALPVDVSPGVEELKGSTEVRILRVDWLILAGDEW